MGQPADAKLTPELARTSANGRGSESPRPGTSFAIRNHPNICTIYGIGKESDQSNAVRKSAGMGPSGFALNEGASKALCSSMSL